MIEVLPTQLSKDMKNVENAVLTERSVDEYTDLLYISKEDFSRWKIIVDLGSGMEQDFAKGMRLLGKSNTIVSIDPKLGLPEDIDLEGLFPEEHSARLSGRRNSEEDTIAALAKHLPVSDSSVDAVLAIASVPRYLTTEKSIKEAFEEVYRILKRGGEGRFYPINDLKDKKIIEEILSSWGDKVEFSLEPSNRDKHLFLLKFKKI